MKTIQDHDKNLDLLIVVELGFQVEDALKKSAGVVNRKFLACSLDAAEVLETANVPYSTLQDFTDETGILTCDAEHYRVVDKLCKALDVQFSKRVPIFGEKDIGAFSLEYFRIKYLHSGAICRLTELVNATSCLQPRRVMAFISDEMQVNSIDIDPYNTILYGNDVKRICAQRGIEFIGVLSKLPKKKQPPQKQVSFFSRAIKVVRQGRTPELIARIAEKICIYMTTASKGGDVLMLQPLLPQTVGMTCASLWKRRLKNPFVQLQRKFSLKRAIYAHSLRCMNVRAEDLLREPDVHPFFVCNGIDWSSYAVPYLDVLIQEEYVNSLRDCLEADQKIQDGTIRCVVANNLGSSSKARRISSRAQKNNIPVLVFHHGAMGYIYEYAYFYQEIRYCSHYFTYTDEISSYIHRQFKVPLITKTVGSPTLDKIRWAKNAPTRATICRQYGLDPHKPIIVYPTYPSTGRSRHLNMFLKDEFTHYKIQNDIFDALLEGGEAQVLIKGLPAENVTSSPFVRRVLDKKSERVVHLTDRLFGDFLDAADCFVLDSPDTVLLESLTKGKPVYVFNQSLTWDTDALELLEKEVVLERESLLNFCDVLKADIISGKAFSPCRRSGDFLRKYADPFEDGKAEERIIAGVIELSRDGHWVQ